MNDWLLTRLARVVAHELAERAFELRLAGEHFAFEQNFRGWGKGQPVKFAANHLVGASSLPARVIVFRDAFCHFSVRAQEQDRILTAGDDDRARLATREIFFTDEPAVLAG